MNRLYKSDIEWTDYTWNPITGCSKTSAGCRHCYAEKMAFRLSGRPSTGYDPKDPFGVTIRPDRLDDPKGLKNGSRIYVCSMSDIFHPEIPETFLRRVFRTMCEDRRHTYQLITKRHKRMLELAHSLPWPDHIWMGVSVEGPDYLHRIDYLRAMPTPNRYVNFEPLIEEIPRDVLNLRDIPISMVGAETGPKARPFDLDWARNIRDAALRDGAQFHMTPRRGSKDRGILDGEIWVADFRSAA